MKSLQLLAAFICFALPIVTQSRTSETYDVIIRRGTIYDGTGNRPRRADIGIRGDRIAAVGNLTDAHAKTIIDARGLAVAPGFINMLSWAVDDLIVDGRSQGDIRQGVTTEIFGEGDSMGPLTGEMRRRRRSVAYSKRGAHDSRLGSANRYAGREGA